MMLPDEFEIVSLEKKGDGSQAHNRATLQSLKQARNRCSHNKRIGDHGNELKIIILDL